MRDGGVTTRRRYRDDRRRGLRERLTASMAAFRESSFTTVVKFSNIIDLYNTFRSNEELRIRLIILKKFTMVAKLFFLLNAAHKL